MSDQQLLHAILDTAVAHTLGRTPPDTSRPIVVDSSSRPLAPSIPPSLTLGQARLVLDLLRRLQAALSANGSRVARGSTP